MNSVFPLRKPRAYTPTNSLGIKPRDADSEGLHCSPDSVLNRHPVHSAVSLHALPRNIDYHDQHYHHLYLGNHSLNRQEHLLVWRNRGSLRDRNWSRICLWERLNVHLHQQHNRRIRDSRPSECNSSLEEPESISPLPSRSAANSLIQ